MDQELDVVYTGLRIRRRPAELIPVSVAPDGAPVME